ncbi:Fe(3+) dicitrate transport ATP-binding protein FecE [Austwickia sp. TVS 96-490-7B]|uniref:ABC transporter ATP-binding protein n=1 Tax=Austwickia sp. TVS 96-490-7B TaxID=2830843 RepID=UPI001C5A402F|nr:ABC transporter ATP-binding protein [Austwickia sp. TVS 96-490-7B]MBW3085508.1 Fe(3+) dicitrate transport ATP-binding protein FecE [Austwickia sp. TVS 96-490-7B]
MDLTFDRIDLTLGGHRILHQVSFTVPTGATVALLGANGSGKSTLLRTAYRVHRPTHGTVRVGGDDVHRIPPVEAARRIAVMTQEISSDFPLTALDVVLLGRVPHQRGFGADSPQDLDLAHDSLTDVGAPHLAARTFASLSGGEKQRILLARALTQQAPVMILDEPTNHADLGFQHDLLHLVTTRGATVLAALHDINLALAYCDQAAVMHHGQLHAHGPVTDVLTPQLLDDTLGVSSMAIPDPRGGQVLSFRRRTTHLSTTTTKDNP